MGRAGTGGIAAVNVEVGINGRAWKVAVQPAERPGQFRVTIKGVSRVVDVSWIDPDTLSLLDRGAAHEVRFHRRSNHGAAGVEIGGTVYEARVPPRGRKTAADSFSPAGGGSHMVKSPMPGRIVRVLVAAGDRVVARQPVIVVEAMKMENELRTPVGGVVKEILAAPGAAVDTGAVLVIVDH